MPSPVREISVVLVSWRDDADTLAAIASFAVARGRVLADGPRTSLVVVDNGGGLSRDAVLAAWPDATVIVNDVNRGFGPAANQGAAASGGDVLLFLNPDTRAVGEPFSGIADAFDSRPDAVAVAPRLVDDAGGDSSGPLLAPPDRENQFTFQLRRLPRLADDARELLLLDHLAPNNRGRRRFRYADRDPESPLEIEQAAGAALAVRSDAFRKAGAFDESFVPAWFEDVDLCARLAEHGAIVYWPAARFRHRGGASSRDLGYRRFLPIYYANALRYRRGRYGVAARLAYRALLVGGMTLRLAALPLRPRPPRTRRESAAAYLRVMALALGLVHR
ncbi:MAG: glycosyltransferase family 2 protein [Acidobacteriota bacterium]